MNKCNLNVTSEKVKKEAEERIKYNFHKQIHDLRDKFKMLCSHKRVKGNTTIIKLYFEDHTVFNLDYPIM